MNSYYTPLPLAPYMKQVDIYVNKIKVCTTYINSDVDNCHTMYRHIRAIKTTAVRGGMPWIDVCDYDTLRVRWHKDA